MGWFSSKPWERLYAENVYGGLVEGKELGYITPERLQLPPATRHRFFEKSLLYREVMSLCALTETAHTDSHLLPVLGEYEVLLETKRVGRGAQASTQHISRKEFLDVATEDLAGMMTDPFKWAQDWLAEFRSDPDDTTGVAIFADHCLRQYQSFKGSLENTRPKEYRADSHLAFLSSKEPTGGKEGVKARAAILQRAAAPRENPWRALNPEGFDKGEKINQWARELQRVAKTELAGSEVVVALQTALGNEIADMAIRRNPNSLPGQKLHVIDQVLDGSLPGVREAAYIAADLPSPPQYEDEKDLTHEELTDLTSRIVNEATKNNVPVNASLTATAKALGLIICILAERPGVSAEELIKLGQEAVAGFTREAQAFRPSQK
jgi:hypothetical protein